MWWLHHFFVVMIRVAPHPLLDLRAFVTNFGEPLGQLQPLPHIGQMLSLAYQGPLSSSDDVRKLVRDLLRHGGFKPTGRSKPASEYLIKAASAGSLAGINVAVDACNVVSLHTGLPISVVDLDLLGPPLRVDVAARGQAYVFNPTGQTIDLGGLLCLFDAQGACANGVKDSQRTKTNQQTRRTLSIVWGTKDLPRRSEQAAGWNRQLLEQSNCRTESAELRN